MLRWPCSQRASSLTAPLSGNTHFRSKFTIRIVPILLWLIYFLLLATSRHKGSSGQTEFQPLPLLLSVDLAKFMCWRTSCSMKVGFPSSPGIIEGYGHPITQTSKENILCTLSSVVTTDLTILQMPAIRSTNLFNQNAVHVTLGGCTADCAITSGDHKFAFMLGLVQSASTLSLVDCCISIRMTVLDVKSVLSVTGLSSFCSALDVLN